MLCNNQFLPHPPLILLLLVGNHWPFIPMLLSILVTSVSGITQCVNFCVTHLNDILACIPLVSMDR